MNAILLLSLLWLGPKDTTPYNLQPGDILFQNMGSAQSLAIEKATDSPYTHVGIYFEKDGKPMVLEAVGPVKYTPLKTWINQGQNQHFVAKRVKDINLTTARAERLRKAGEKYLGIAYDSFFEWSNKRIYCSELIWKMYHESLSIEIGKKRPWQDYDLSHPEVKRILRQRFGNKIPTTEPAVAPSDMFESELLTEVATHRSI